ncbi:MAG TPA: 16S rRNA (uracil(1498)-N(3))-methyltransferase [Desulfarculaceae bacterium]|nr:16S rRNA (uracil(1498)-N(3))-methyltransferase [Desulfarculaceae bacterium]
MNIVLIEETDFIGPHRVLLKERQARHVIKVLRAKVGDKIRTGLVNGRIGDALIHTVSDSRVEFEVGLTDPAPAALPVTLLLALPRPKVFKRVLSAAITMGVKKIFIFNTWRVDKSYWQTPLLQTDKLNEISLLALEQAVDTKLPEITLKPLFRPFVEDEVPNLARDHKNAWLLHPHLDPVANKNEYVSLTGSTLIAIGPEGGFIPFEVEMFMAAGLKQFSLGPRILRVEQAVPAALTPFLMNIS